MKKSRWEEDEAEDHRRPSPSKDRSHSTTTRIKQERHSSDDERESDRRARRNHEVEAERARPSARPPRADRQRKRKAYDEPSEEEQNNYEWGKKEDEGDGEDKADKDEPAKKVKLNFKKSGKLAEEANRTEKGFTLKWAEPADAKRPHDKKWRLYPFKGDQALDPIPVYRKSSYLFGRDRNVADIPTDHPSCSGQHAVLQFRQVSVQDEDDIGPPQTVVKPYIIDLNSSNGTFLNSKLIDRRRFYELLPKDVLKFAHSSREYVLLHDELA
ncbi:Smad nuclear-interacting protein 1 [Balamuthia mandrillaris]